MSSWDSHCKWNNEQAQSTGKVAGTAQEFCNVLKQVGSELQIVIDLIILEI